MDATPIRASSNLRGEVEPWSIQTTQPAGSNGGLFEPLSIVIDIWTREAAGIRLVKRDFPLNILRRFSMHARKRLKNIGRLNVTSIVANRVLRKNLLDNSVHLLSPFKTPGRVVLVLILNPGVNVLPDHASFEMLWSWMHGADLYYMDLPSSNLEEIALPTDSFFDLVNLYAAAGIISLQPTPRYIESAVFQYISDNPLSAAEIKTIWDRVPKTDRVFAHIAHNYYHHLQAGRISLEEEEAIWAYTERIPDLSQIFLDVERIRDQKKVETEEKEEFGTPQQTHQQRRRNRGRRATVPRAPSQS